MTHSGPTGELADLELELEQPGSTVAKPPAQTRDVGGRGKGPFSTRVRPIASWPHCFCGKPSATLERLCPSYFSCCFPNFPLAFSIFAVSGYLCFLSIFPVARSKLG